MELWDVCVRMSEVYGVSHIKLRVGVTKPDFHDGPEISDFDERICEFSSYRFV
jgi:hypothetical protein